MDIVGKNTKGGYGLTDVFGNTRGTFPTIAEAFNKLAQNELKKKFYYDELGKYVGRESESNRQVSNTGTTSVNSASGTESNSTGNYGTISTGEV